MANEIVIEEYGEQSYQSQGHIAGGALGELITTQVIDMGATSAVFNDRTSYVVMQSVTGAFWYKPGTNPTAAANTDGNVYVKDGGTKEFPITADITKVDTVTA